MNKAHITLNYLHMLRLLNVPVSFLRLRDHGTRVMTGKLITTDHLEFDLDVHTYTELVECGLDEEKDEEGELFIYWMLQEDHECYVRLYPVKDMEVGTYIEGVHCIR